jgi:DNA-binding PadR family transcriptional regulator
MMDLPMSRSQITEFIIDKELMNHFTLEENLAEMVERGFLEVTHENAKDVSTTRYTLTEDGVTSLEFLESQIPRPAQTLISQYVRENRSKIKKSFEKTANYFPNIESDEYTVKLAILDDKRGSTLMEIQVPVITREQAKHIQSLYERILLTLTEV